MNKEELQREVLPILRQFLNILESDSQLHPAQASNAIYTTPEGQLQRQIDLIHQKRDTEVKLRELIEKINS